MKRFKKQYGTIDRAAPPSGGADDPGRAPGTIDRAALFVGSRRLTRAATSARRRRLEAVTLRMLRGFEGAAVAGAPPGTPARHAAIHALRAEQARIAGDARAALARRGAGESPLYAPTGTRR